MKALSFDLSFWLLILCSDACGHAAILTDLGVLPGYTFSEARAISADGRIVVGSVSRYENDQSWIEPFMWTAERAMAGLGFLPECTNCVAIDTSTNGVIVGHCIFTDRVVAFRWTLETGMNPLPNPESHKETFATAVSANGQVIVGYVGSRDSYYAVKWTGLNEYGQLAPVWSQARDVSGDGTVIVGNYIGSQSDQSRAVRWRAGHPIELLDTVVNPGADFTLYSANGVSLDGEVVVGACDTPLNNEAYLWSADIGFITLGNIDTASYAPMDLVPRIPASIWSEAYAVSNDGRRAVGRNWPGWTTRSFIWSAEKGPHSLKKELEYASIFQSQWETFWTFDSGFPGDYTWDISADGTRIVGSAPSPLNPIHAYVLDIRDLRLLKTQSGWQLTWLGGFKLQQASDLSIWQDVANAISPFPISASGAVRFYRILRVP